MLRKIIKMKKISINGDSISFPQNSHYFLHKEIISGIVHTKIIHAVIFNVIDFCPSLSMSQCPEKVKKFLTSILNSEIASLNDETH